MRMQVILDSLFARPGSAPIWGGMIAWIDLVIVWKVINE